MNAKQLLEFGWSAFRFAAGRPCSDTAPLAFAAHYREQSLILERRLNDDPEAGSRLLGELANHLVQAGRDTGLACRGAEITGELVEHVLTTRQAISGTTLC